MLLFFHLILINITEFRYLMKLVSNDKDVLNVESSFGLWSKRKSCPDHEHYGFIDNPPTNKRLDFVNAWKGIAEYFRSKNHSIISRYPVVCRWRDDLYFTIASIVDFQRVMGSKVVFEIPANPLIVPQMCLRFNDVENVGRSGRHYTSFCMIGQTCDADSPVATGKTNV